MRFNVSRFLVRIRQFWTRRRLVPVLGFATLALFLLNFWAFIDYQFNSKTYSTAYGMHSGSFFPGKSEAEVIIRDYSLLKENNQITWHRHSHSDKHVRRFKDNSYKWECTDGEDCKKSFSYRFEVKRFEEEARKYKKHAERRHHELERLLQDYERAKVKEIDILRDTEENQLIIKRLMKEPGERLDQDVSIIINGIRVEG